MSKALDALREEGLFNPHMVLTRYAQDTGADMPVAILYRTQETGRVYRSAAWQVYRPGFKTDPHTGVSRWWDHGLKTFDVFSGEQTKPDQLEAAKAWASERYGVAEWASIPGFRDDMFPAVVAAWVKRLLKEGSPAVPVAAPAPSARSTVSTPARAQRRRPRKPSTPAHIPQRAHPRSVR